MAVLAASGASFAQATITGGFNYGYRQTSSFSGAANGYGSPAGDSGGFGVRDSNITFGFGEDLGGGMKATGQLKIDTINRASIKGGDAFLALSGSFGTLTLASAEQDVDAEDLFAYGDALGGAGPTLGQTLYTRSEATQDIIKYGKDFGPVNVSFKHAEAAVDGIGLGAAGKSTQRDNTLEAIYSSGPIVVKANYTSFDNKTDGIWGSFDSRYTLGGSYDLGVAKLALGVQNTKHSVGSALESVISGSVPVGALTLSADYVNVKISDSGAAGFDGTASGYALQGNYALSKRTGLRLRYFAVDGTMNPTDKDRQTELVMTHTF